MHGFSVSSWISAISAESSWKSANSSWKSANRSLCYLIIMSPQWCMHSSKILHVLWANSSWNSANSSWKSANSSWNSANSSWAQRPENRKAQIKRPTPIVRYIYIYIFFHIDLIFPLIIEIRTPSPRENPPPQPSHRLHRPAPGPEPPVQGAALWCPFHVALGVKRLRGPGAFFPRPRGGKRDETGSKTRDETD